MLKWRFNPRSRAGSDFRATGKPCLVVGFQSTLPRGERLEIHHRRGDSISVSIHAPARGATSLPIFGLETLYRFNPRSRAGSDFLLPLSQCQSLGFNPRSRAGSDSPSADTQPTGYRFQSTLPRGERQNGSGSQMRWYCVSIHAPARGATQNCRTCTRRPSFQSTLPRGERPMQMRKDLGCPRVSIHAPARGATCITICRSYA